MNAIGVAALYIGVVALLLGYLGIAFCGFALGFWRGIRNIVVPFVAFGDAYNQFPRLLWLWGGGVALVSVGALLTR